VGFYAGDGDLVHYLSEVRKHVGMLVPGPVQAAAVAAWADDSHVDEQRERYRRRLTRGCELLKACGVDAQLPRGAFYLWAPAPDRDDWGLAERLARDAGALVTPGDTFGPAGTGHVRVALVQPDERLELLARRLGL
jgi:aspartate/methionine/tyrosine aminotransferase